MFKLFFPHYKTSIRYAFTLQCPNQDNQLTLSLLNDATVRGGIHYYDVCKVADSVTIAYNNDESIKSVSNANDVIPKFEFVPDTQTMKEYPVIPVNGWYSYIPRDWEIIKPFLDHYSLTPTWIDCQNTPGWFDKETGTWTGAVGKVRNCA